jgi:hypothetical protein
MSSSAIAVLEPQLLYGPPNEPEPDAVVDQLNFGKAVRLPQEASKTMDKKREEVFPPRHRAAA